jgi:hypothetical protein
MSKDRLYLFDTTLRDGVVPAKVGTGFAVRDHDHSKTVA